MQYTRPSLRDKELPNEGIFVIYSPARKPAQAEMETQHRETLEPITTELASVPLSYSVAVVGLGYVGLPLALLAARKGHRVVGIDVSEKKIASIREGNSPFYDEAITRHLAETKLQADTDFARVRDADIVIVCVPTPVRDDHSPDLEPLIKACESIAAHLSPGSLIVIESTVNPGICDTIVIPTLEKHSTLIAGRDFMVSHCPERVNPGDERWGVDNINRVAGSLTPQGLEKTLLFYRSIVSGEVRPMGSLKEAEAVKIVENTFRDINIAFVNELAMSFDRMGIDIVNVIDAASTKPFAFMPHYPGCGVGGHCIPVDPYYLIEEGRRHGFDHEFLSLARRINNRMPIHSVDMLEQLLSKAGLNIAESRIAVLGLAYKADIDDMRESPAHDILKELAVRGATTVAFDPYIHDDRYASSLDEALLGAQAAIIATPHKEFRNLHPRDFLDRGVEIVLDGKNCLPKKLFLDSGITYKGIGR